MDALLTHGVTKEHLFFQSNEHTMTIQGIGWNGAILLFGVLIGCGYGESEVQQPPDESTKRSPKRTL